jgi:mono/diheme cytochrome c family protein
MLKKKPGRPRQTDCLESHQFAQQGRCKVCARKRARTYRARHAGTIHDRDRARKATLRARQDGQAALARARAIVGVNVRRGKVVRPTTCAECHSPHPVPYHADPAAPLAVEWLCRSCRRYRIETVDTIAESVAAEQARIESEEEAARRIAAQNEVRRSGQEIYDAFDAVTRADVDAAHDRNDTAVIAGYSGSDDAAIALTEFLERRANHRRAREAMRRRMGTA